ncbi:MAG: hypothetical protein NTY62_02000 [Euryarchaeota archaeon]|nr:hypothetical protein [Euryarchaeota archaeon]
MRSWLSDVGWFDVILAQKAYLETVKPYFGGKTLETMTRGLRAIHNAFQELKQDRLESTASTDRISQNDVEAFTESMKRKKTKHGIGLDQATQANYLECLVGILRFARIQLWNG